MTDESAMLAAIWAHPSDDLVRLVYADWLDEHDQQERAEFIRLQCERARIEQHWDAADQLPEIKRREEELWTAHRQAWRAGLPRALRNSPFRRGFVYPWRVFGGEKFLGLQSDALNAAPIWAGQIEKFVRLFDRVFAVPHLLRFDELAISVGREEIPFSQLAGNELLRNVSDLRLSHKSNIDPWDDPDGVAAYFNGPATASVTRLQCYAHLGSESFAAMAESRTARNLTHLRLDSWRIAADAGQPITAARFPQLRSLRLDTRGINFIRCILDTPGIRWRELDFHGYGLSDELMAELAAWPGLAQVRSLDLSGSYSRCRAGFQALARSPLADGLRHLKVDEVVLREMPEVKAELEARFGPALELWAWKKGHRT